jgi:hypothetical protein
MSYEKSQHETETLNADEQKLRELCLALKKVEAPKDFDFKLKARMASAKPADFQPRFGLALRYALPALALILVFGLLAFSGGFWSSNNNPPVAQSSDIPPTSVPQNSPTSSSAPPQIDKQPDASVAVANPDSQKTPEKSQPPVAVYNIQNSKRDVRENKKDSLIRSKDFALTEDKTKQPNFNAVTMPGNSQNLEKSNPIPVKDVLSINGINANFENGKWTVKSVTANSVGESSGVKENDIVEAIDEQPLAGETINGKNFSGKTITVTRNGEKSQIKLRNKQ